MPVVKIALQRIKDWESFHDVFAETLGFPGFYGRNMSAWVDFLSSLDEPDHGMTTVHVGKGEVLTLQLTGYTSFKEQHPALLNEIVECAAFVNWRRVQAGLD